MKKKVKQIKNDEKKVKKKKNSETCRGSIRYADTNNYNKINNKRIEIFAIKKNIIYRWNAYTYTLYLI